MYHSRKNHAEWICQYQKCSCICQEPSRITGKGSKTAAFRFLSKFSRIKIENIKIKAPSNLYHLPLPPRGSLALVTHICNFCQRKGASWKDIQQHEVQMSDSGSCSHQVRTSKRDIMAIIYEHATNMWFWNFPSTGLGDIKTIRTDVMNNFSSGSDA